MPAAVNFYAKKTMKKTILFLVLALSLVGCGSYLAHSEDVSRVKKPYDKVLVLAWAENQVARSLFEKDVVEALGKKGIIGVRSLDSGIDFPLGQKPTESEAAAIGNDLRSKGFDGVVITHLVDTEQYREVLPESFSPGFYPAYSMHFGGYLGYFPANAWQPERMLTGTRYVFESALYDLDSPRDENLQWIGYFVLEDPTDIRETTSRYARELVAGMQRSSMSAPRKRP